MPTLTGKDYGESGTLFRDAGPDQNSTMVFNDLFTNGQANACSLVMFFLMKPLKDREYFLNVNIIEANAIVHENQFQITFGIP